MACQTYVYRRRYVNSYGSACHYQADHGFCAGIDLYPEKRLARQCLFLRSSGPGACVRPRTGLNGRIDAVFSPVPKDLDALHYCFPYPGAQPFDGIFGSYEEAAYEFPGAGGKSPSQPYHLSGPDRVAAHARRCGLFGPHGKGTRNRYGPETRPFELCELLVSSHLGILVAAVSRGSPGDNHGRCTSVGIRDVSCPLDYRCLQYRVPSHKEIPQVFRERTDAAASICVALRAGTFSDPRRHHTGAGYRRGALSCPAFARHLKRDRSCSGLVHGNTAGVAKEFHGWITDPVRAGKQVSPEYDLYDLYHIDIQGGPGGFSGCWRHQL